MTPATRPLRILLAEDSVLLREGLVRVLTEAGFQTVAAVGDATRLEELILKHEPDVAVLDVRMPPTFRDEGVQAAIRLRQLHPDLGILLLSQYVEATYARELLRAGRGGIGYLLKDRVSSLDELRDAIERVADGGTALDPVVVSELMSRRSDPLDALTRRESEVLALMAQGRSNAAIAAALVIGTGAVEKNVTGIFLKLGLEDSGSEHRRVLAVLAFLER
jgi:DNA-binding NarL/FixJ family response regulator